MELLIAWGLLCLGLGLSMGFFIGVINERRKWNDLVARGVLPKPRKG